jgi:hypothetical protein
MTLRTVPDLTHRVKDLLGLAIVKLFLLLNIYA